MATHSSMLAWKSPRTEKPGGLYSPWCTKESDTTEHKAVVIQQAPPTKCQSWPQGSQSILVFAVCSTHKPVRQEAWPGLLTHFSDENAEASCKGSGGGAGRAGLRPRWAPGSCAQSPPPSSPPSLTSPAQNQQQLLPGLAVGPALTMLNPLDPLCQAPGTKWEIRVTQEGLLWGQGLLPKPVPSLSSLVLVPFHPSRAQPQFPPLKDKGRGSR